MKRIGILCAVTVVVGLHSLAYGQSPTAYPYPGPTYPNPGGCSSCQTQGRCLAKLMNWLCYRRTPSTDKYFNPYPGHPPLHTWFSDARCTTHQACATSGGNCFGYRPGMFAKGDAPPMRFGTTKHANASSPLPFIYPATKYVKPVGHGVPLPPAVYPGAPTQLPPAPATLGSPSPANYFGK
jgi:hypothetical protein